MSMKYPNLKAELARMNMTVDQLAKATNLNPQTIYSWQSGATPSVEKALAVSDALNADVRYLFATEPITAQ